MIDSLSRARRYIYVNMADSPPSRKRYRKEKESTKSEEDDEN